VVHRDYASNASVQVMLFADRLEVWNPGELPAPLTFARLRRPHASIPHNPLVCEPVFLARYAEKAGSGILDMIALCREAGLPEPEFRADDGQFVQTIWRPRTVAATQVTTQVEHERKGLIDSNLEQIAAVLGLAVKQVTTQVTTQVVEVLKATAGEGKSREEIQTAIGMKNREHFRKTYVEPLVKGGWLEWTIPGKPTSRLQKYRLAEKGRAWLASRESEAKPT
jgi:predicted HTH transcriptional regulator